MAGGARVEHRKKESSGSFISATTKGEEQEIEQAVKSLFGSLVRRRRFRRIPDA
jgi:hypothetical protein